MLYEIKKAFESLLHPGIETNLLDLIRNAVPYYLYPSMEAKPPLTLYFSINSVCNLHCKMCDVGTINENGTFFKNLRIDKKLHEIEINVFRSIIDEVYMYKPFISFSSTEPLLYKKLEEAITYCTEKGLRTAVTTGGYNLPKQAESLARAGLSRLNVSIDGPPKIHNNIRGKIDSFERDIEGIKLFIDKSKEYENNSEVHVSCVISNLNYQYLIELADLLKTIPITKLNFAHLWYISDNIAMAQNNKFGSLYPVTTSCYDEYVTPKEIDVDVLFEQSQVLSKRKNIDFFPLLSKKNLKKYYHTDEFIEKSSKCLASWFFVQILADGRVMPFTRCHNESFGNINDEKFMDIWNGKKIKEWRKFIKKNKKMPMCTRCDLVN